MEGSRPARLVRYDHELYDTNFTDENLPEAWAGASVLRPSLVERGLNGLISDATGEPVVIVGTNPRATTESKPEDQRS